jgi:hypothetical protein
VKLGRELGDIAKQIQHESEAKKDFATPTNKLTYTPRLAHEHGAIHWRAASTEYEATPTRHCLRQICERSGIPAKYAEKMSGEHSSLLAQNINHWWKNTPEKRMLRTFMNGESIARAFVSDRYRALDNYDLAEAVLPKLSDAGCEVKSCEITETRLYIQAVTPRLELDLNKLRAAGTKLSEIDPVQAGVVISNSEVGAGALNLDQLLWRCVCLNGMVAGRVMRRHHVGRKQDPLWEMQEEVQHFSDATRKLDDAAFWAKVRDVVDAILSLDRFTTLAQKFANAGAVRISAMDAVEEVTNRYQLVETEKNGVLNHLIEGGELSLFGLVNAVTRMSSDVESYDRAVELERIGGEILELPHSTWEVD